MKQICKQCGREFELSDGEIQFYKSKNLNIPKRCKACREKNRDNNRVSNYSTKPDNSGYGYRKYKRSSLRYIFPIVFFVLIITFDILSQSTNFFGGKTTDTGVQTGEQLNAHDICFRNSELLNKHYQKHGIAMGFSSAKEYEAAAVSVVENSNSLHKKEKEDGDDVYYLESSNEFVIVSTDGYIRTYFKPDDGISYYNKQ